MEDGISEAMSPPEHKTGDLDSMITFLSALFDERDLILFRPIESWTEAGRKRSRVDYSKTCYRVRNSNLLTGTLEYLLKKAATDRLNLFFGVCPRLGPNGRFDLAWQIRTVRALWTDIDHVSVADAEQRIAQAGLPKPSILVHSGNGVHAYWLLDEAFLIDDVGRPPPVETEWNELPEGRKKPRKYILEDGERVYLDQRRHIGQLSPKAQRYQDLLAGIAQVLGGDHTTDLSRLLRLPGTFNRKDEQNGREPTPCKLIDCDPTRKYSITMFETFATPGPETERAKQIASMPLPRPRRLTHSKADKLDEHIATCAIASAGARSEADFALCCFAVRSGIAKDDVWSQVAQVGKFAEQGERYFNLTWEKAEYQVRSDTFTKLERKTGGVQRAESQSISSNNNHDPPGITGEFGDEHSPDGLPTIYVDSTTTPVAVTMRSITDRLLEVGGCFSRQNQLVVISDDSIAPVLSAPELAGLLNQHVEFFFIDDDGGQYKPLPGSYGNTWLNHPGERPRLPTIKLFTHNPVFTDDWRLTPPGYDPQSGIYYAGPAVSPRDDLHHLNTLLKDFCFKTRGDRTNYLGMLLTTLLMPRFIGSKPAVLFNGNQPELGKSVLAQTIAILRDGQPVETASYNPNDEEFEKRLGSIVRRGATTIIIDNAKGRARNPRIESACLERSITDPILSFRLLGYSQDIRAENSHIFCITANSPDVSRDLVTRSVIVNLYYEGNPERRTFSMDDPEGYAQEHRLELLGELIGMVERWKAAGYPEANIHSRFNKRGWGPIIGGILAANNEPDFLANAEEAATLLDDTRREFSELVAVMADHPQGTWTAAQLVGLCSEHRLLQEELGDGSPRSQATKLGGLAGRFIDDTFEITGGRSAVFTRSQDRNGNIYRVGIRDEVRNL